MRPLIAFVPVANSSMTGLISYKPINLPTIEMRKGPEHVDKVLNESSYNSVKGEVKFVHASLTHPSQDSILSSKVTVTSFWVKSVENRNLNLNPAPLTWNTVPKMEAKDEPKDTNVITGDLLNQAIGILGQETKTL